MDVHLPLLQRCFQEAAALSGSALERCIVQVMATFEAAEGGAHKTAERDRLMQARVGLRALQGTWGAQYTADLLAAFNPSSPAVPDPVEPAAPLAGAPDSPDSGLGGLSLVDDAQIEQDIEFARLSMQLRSQVEPIMADLDALVCAAQGLTRVLPERNGLRPEVFGEALRGLVNGANAAPEIRALWLKNLAAPLGAELREIYNTIIDRLTAANVQAVSYQWISSAPAAGAGGGRGDLGPAGGGGWRGAQAMGSQGHNDPGGDGYDGQGDGPGYSVNPLEGNTGGYWVEPSHSGVNPVLFRRFLVHGVDNRARLAEAYYERVDEELQALRAEAEPASDGYRGEFFSATLPLGAGDSVPRRLDGQSLLNARAWGEYARERARKLARAELRREATHVGQVLALEVVRKLVNEVAQDPRLLVPVREAIVALEPSLGRLAMVDPRFFTEESHPGRLLMERVAQRSFRYNDEESSGFPEFVESLRRSFTALNELKIDSAEPFSSALSTLETAWTERDRDGEDRSHQLQHGLRFAEERQALADQIAFDLSSRPDLDKVPGPVLDFLYGPWALVMAHARLIDQDRQIDPQGMGRLVSDLVWSVKHGFTLRQPARLMKMIPAMVSKLNAGLDLIGQDPKERKAFLDILMRLHRPVLKLRRLKSERDARESSAHSLEADLLAATPEQRAPKAAVQPWLAPHEQDNAGFEDSLPPGSGEPDAEAGPGEPGAEPVAAGASGLEPTPEPAAGGAATPAPDPEQVERMLSSLHTGCWVDLFSRQRWRRAQLVWSSNRGTLFMFLSHGGRPHSMTRRHCERLLAHGLLRPVETHGVVARALSALTTEVQATGPLPLHQHMDAASSPPMAQAT